jgi:hypothetical protein
MIDTKKNIFSPNSAIDFEIKKLLPSFSTDSQARMRKAILSAKKSVEKHHDDNSDASARHIFREFIPASILNQNGFNFEYEKNIKGKKPDWLDDSSRIMFDSYTYERGGTSSFLSRLNSSITDKCNKYKDIITDNSLNFMVAVYLDFFTCMSLDDCRDDVKSFLPIFDANSPLWAILFFTETHVIGGRQQYEFFCICSDTSFDAVPNWPFNTIKIRS